MRRRELLRERADSRRSVRQVARETGMSPFHFIRLFKAVFGETPKQCQLSARLDQAKHLFRTNRSEGLMWLAQRDVECRKWRPY
jgi:AraC-like DNA-binding protein